MAESTTAPLNYFPTEGELVLYYYSNFPKILLWCLILLGLGTYLAAAAHRA
jgi:hypothetical protein